MAFRFSFSFKFLFRLRRATFLASPRKVAKRRRPYGAGSGAYAPELPCDARSLRRLRNSPPAGAQTVLADHPSDRCASRRHQRGTPTAHHWFAFDLRSWGTLGVAEQHSRTRRFRRGQRVPQVARTAEQVSKRNALGCDPGAGQGAPSSRVTMCACAAASPLRGAPALRSGAPEGGMQRRVLRSEAEERCPGCVSLCLLSLAQARESRSPRGETEIWKKGKDWIPAFAGMTVLKRMVCKRCVTENYPSRPPSG